MENILNGFIVLLMIGMMLIEPIRTWDNEDLELFDLVEEINYLNKTFYEVLSLSQSASSSDIRRAYRKLSLKLHPDHNKDPNAAAQFRQLVSISEVLRDEVKRQKYDQILKTGLPDWRQAVYYYRKVRKFGLIELGLILFLIMTSGQYIVSWSIYFERRYELEEVLGAKLRKRDKKLKKSRQANEDTSKNIEQEANQIPKPQLQNLLPFLIIRGIFSAITSLPYCYMLVKTVIMNRVDDLLRPTVQSEDEADLSTSEEHIRKPRRRRIFEIPDFTSECLLESVDGPNSESSRGPVSNTNGSELSKMTTDDGGVLKASEWTEEDIAALTKAMQKIPSGTNERWEKIAELLHRSFRDVTNMAKILKNNTSSKSVSAGIQGLTATKLLPEVIMAEEGTHRELEDGARNVPVSCDKSAGETSDTVTSSNEKTDGVHNSSNVHRDISSKGNSIDIWTQIQQRALELALTHFPKGSEERWDKIAKCVPDKSKEDCIKRFKLLAEQVKRKRNTIEN